MGEVYAADDLELGDKVALKTIRPQIAHDERAATRFRSEIQAERAVPLLTASVAIAEACLSAEANPDDRRDVSRFLPRLLRMSVTQGAWLEARESMRLLGSCDSAEWSLDAFVQELLQPIQARVNSVIQGIRAEMNYTLILDADVAGGLIAAADPALNITARVLQRLQQAQ